MKVVVSAVVMLLLSVQVFAQTKVCGVVTAEGKPLAGVNVSDGRDIVQTDSLGRYEIVVKPWSEHVYITPPSGYSPESEDGFAPGFFAHLVNDGTPETHDFRLRKECQDNYSMIFLTDLHLTNADFKPDLKTFKEVAAPAIRNQVKAASSYGPVYLANLGDLSHERYWYQYDYNVSDAYNTLKEANLSALVYSVPGNHDNDGAIKTDNTDWDAGHLYRKTIGPEYYSVNIGKDHWLFLDDILFVNGPFKPNRPRAVGAAGSLSYEKGFTKNQMEWLKQDLSYLSDTTRVFICVHSPIVSDGSKGYTFRKGQMDTLSTMFSRFGKVMIYAGHMHRTYFMHSTQYPVFETTVLTATSGDMWESQPNRVLGIEGEDGGVYVVNYLKDGDKDSWQSHLFGEKVMRVFDMNTVAKHYRKDKDIRRQLEKYPQRLDYADKEFRNMILVNYWMYKSGQTVEVFENGRLLDVEKVTYEDPLFNVSYYLHLFLDHLPVKPSQKTIINRHAFAARANSSKSDVLVRVKDAEGKVIYEELVKRPKPFTYEMK